MILAGLLLAAIAIQAWAWSRLRRRVASGELTKLRASIRYGGWAVSPLLLVSGPFFGLVGLEEVTGRALVPELLGRAALPLAAMLLGIAICGWLAFTIRGASS